MNARVRFCVAQHKDRVCKPLHLFRVQSGKRIFSRFQRPESKDPAQFTLESGGCANNAKQHTCRMLPPSTLAVACIRAGVFAEDLWGLSENNVSLTDSEWKAQTKKLYLFIYLYREKKKMRSLELRWFRWACFAFFFFLFLRCPISFLMPFNPICVTLCVGRWRRKTSKLSKLKSLKVHAVSGYGEFIFCSNKFCCSFFCGVHHILSRTIVKQRWRLE